MDESSLPPGSQPAWASRRRFPRYRLETDLVVVEVRSGVTRSVKGRSRDLCEGGLGGILAEELNPNETVLVEFPLPPARQGTIVRARVHRHSASHYGFEFLQTSPAVVQDIRKACETLPRHS